MGTKLFDMMQQIQMQIILVKAKGRDCVMKGVTIGEHSVVGLGSIVTKDIPPHTVAAGNPAKVVKEGVDWKMGFINI